MSTFSSFLGSPMRAPAGGARPSPARKTALISSVRAKVVPRRRVVVRAGADGEGDEAELKTKVEQVKSGDTSWGESFPQKKAVAQERMMKDQGVTQVAGSTPSQILSKLAGSSAPMGDAWDPLNLTAGLTDIEVKRYREAELAHCRVCMLASLGFIVGENFPVVNDIFNGGISGPAINQFQQIQRPFWELIIFGIGLAETTRAQIGWMPPDQALFELRPGYDPGDLSWDPLGLRPSAGADLVEMRNKELNNGRLAMIGTAGMIVQELVDEQPILPLHGGFFGP